MSIFQAVKEQVTTREAAEYYGIQVKRNGMARCIFHDDRNPSMKLDRRYHCFGCQADGDVIDFVSKMFGLTPYEAASKLAVDFGICVPEQNTCAAILQSEAMEDYIQADKFDFEADKELCRKLYKEFVEENDDLDALLEEQNIYWNGDKELIDSFVLKTIKSFEDGKVVEQPLKAEFKDDEDRQFAIDLLHYGLDMAQEREQVVAANCRRWDPSRLAFLDVIIIQVAMAEMVHFPGIPLRVTMNEYVELAKSLSTPASGSFVNGMLDTIVKDLSGQGRINKEL